MRLGLKDLRSLFLRACKRQLFQKWFIIRSSVVNGPRAIRCEEKHTVKKVTSCEQPNQLLRTSLLIVIKRLYISSFCSGEPLDVTFMANKNSLKSIKPELSVSNVRKTCSQKASADPEGKKSL
uniref:Uncharacterized protein n=1 Tax=Romanomermis culicivorax TaxID=13658 RepID=A0A915L7N7_ROMCU